MRVRVEVTGRALNLRGPVYSVGERLFLDTDDQRHREVLESGWVRVLGAVEAEPPTAPSPVVAAAVSGYREPPADKMLRAPDQPASAGRKPVPGRPKAKGF